MIKPQFLKKQFQKSIGAQSTAPFLRRFVIRIVDEVAQAHYGAEHPMKCTQTAGAIQVLLAELGIASRLTMGAVCFPKINSAGHFVGWSGFWEDDHHIWLTTQFYEVVDLSISQQHDHPSTEGEEMPTPAIWWDQAGGWPPIMRYLEDTFVDRIALSCPDEQTSYERFVAKVGVAFSSALSERDVKDFTFKQLLMDVDQLNQWTETKHPWATAALFVPEHQVAFPAWIIERQEEIERALERNEEPASRLSNRLDLIDRT